MISFLFIDVQLHQCSIKSLFSRAIVLDSLDTKVTTIYDRTDVHCDDWNWEWIEIEKGKEKEEEREKWKFLEINVILSWIELIRSNNVPIDRLQISEERLLVVREKKLTLLVTYGMWDSQGSTMLKTQECLLFIYSRTNSHLSSRKMIIISLHWLIYRKRSNTYRQSLCVAFDINWQEIEEKEKEIKQREKDLLTACWHHQTHIRLQWE